MGISEFAVHNVLRTYSRQEGIGRAQRAKSSATVLQPTDQVTLSATGRKAQWLGQLAVELVDGRGENLAAEERSAQLRATKDNLFSRHKDDVANEGVSPEDFETSLRALYLP